MKTQPKAMDKLTTILTVEPLDDGTTEIVVQDVTWRAERLGPGQLEVLRKQLGLPAKGDDHQLIGKTIVQSMSLLVDLPLACWLFREYYCKPFNEAGPC